MTHPWEADVTITLEVASQLIECQFPELAPVTLETFGAGWDNTAFLANEEWVFRFPHRELGHQTMCNELAVLPELAGHLTLPIPEPCFIGSPDASYPYRFAGYRLLSGTTACQVLLTREAEAKNARLLGAFLRSLHQLSVREPDSAPRDPFERTNMSQRLESSRARIDGLRETLPLEWSAIESLMTELAQPPYVSRSSCWVHGDFYARHVLVDSRHRACGVIDWGDAHMGDPGLDLSIVYSLIRPALHPLFWNAYGGTPDAETLRLARFSSLFSGLALVYFASSTDDSALLCTGLRALELASS